ncbi:hypothetical protein JCM3775_001148 [Rhodotorula graminis]|uniref:UDP-galactose transporter n=1 Tax=Rhodotorula graminis (strain WP1) TaxID=578459 RepID=A0A0P9EXE0_RHOGW|nr:uncharacterized protein RHOBADRAFT_47518 [Rhodotorula graminis WP1]KPV71814.1 hypothetical protein RHOBADRAFT_47518 [Rhodotorula graminis WP1]
MRQRLQARAAPVPFSTNVPQHPTQAVESPPSPPVDRNRLSKRTIALVLLCLQNASVSLLTRLSRTSTRPPGAPLYEPAVAVFTAECIKCAVSLSMLARQRQRAALPNGKGEGKRGRGPKSGLVAHALGAVHDLVAHQKAEMLKLAVPAALYALQNTLLYTALSNLDAATYQTTYQLKLLTTALFSILFFRRSLSRLRWAALVLLTAGVAIVQLESTDMAAGTARLAGTADDGQDRRKGFAAILAACVSSGLAGAWFEWVLKSPAASPSPSSALPRPPPPPRDAPSSPDKAPPSPPLALRANSPTLWARNLQLSVPSLCFSLVGVALCAPVSRAWAKGGLGAAATAAQGLWAPFDALVWGVVLNQALGGLLVAMVVRFADSVAKGFATSIAIVLSTLASAALFSLVPGPQFLLGAGLVIASTVLYSLDKD